MKTKTIRAFAAAVLAAAAPVLFAQEEKAPAGLSDDQALELARIVNAETGDTKAAIETVVKDVLANAGEAANTVAGEISAALAAAVIAQGGKNVAQSLADIVAAVAASAPADGAAALAERATAAIVAATGLRSFAELVPEDIAPSVADAAEDPFSVITAKDASRLKDLFTRILAILTPDTYTPHSDNDAMMLSGRGSGSSSALDALSSKNRDDSGKSKKKKGVQPRPSPTPTGLR